MPNYLREVRNLITGNSDKQAHEAAEKKDGNMTDAPLGRDDSAWGLDVLVEGADPVVDIVAIHGLEGHREATWTANDINWLRHPKMLPTAIPNARIMSWGYDANTCSTKELAEMYLYDHARKLVSDLSLHRRLDKTDMRPLIFIAHSLGGIVLKSALIHSDSTRDNHLLHHRSIKTSTYGIIFMGTPHQGGEGVAWGKRLVNIASIFVKTSTRLLNIIERDSEALQQQLGQYNSISGDFETKFAFETKATRLARGISIIVVPKASAVVPGQVDAEPIAIMDDHINMVKFSSQTEGYKSVAYQLKLMVKKAPRKVRENWSTEQRVNSARTRNHKPDFDVSFDLTRIPVTSTFIGRKEDLEFMKKHLLRGRQSDRCQICIICGLGGIGKTQLAIEYARVHKAAYTSVFWVDGTTEDSILQSLSTVGTRLPNGQIREVDIQTLNTREGLKERAQEVLHWFAQRGNTRWLLIYDNIDKTSYGEEATDHNHEFYDIREYLPKSDSGSVIITTRLQRLGSLGNPVYLRPLSLEDGLSLLETHAGRDLKRRASTNIVDTCNWDLDAVSLVQRLGYLPLALVIAGSYISRTTVANYRKLYDESWERLHRNLKLNDYPERTIITTWQISFDELKGKNEAAAKLLQLWGYLDNKKLWFELLQWPGYEQSAPQWLRKITADKVNFREAIDMLAGYSLVDNNENSETYSIHLVLQDWVRESLDGKEVESILRTAITSVGLAASSQFEKGDRITQRRILQHAIQISKHRSCIRSFNSCSDHAYLASLYNLGYLLRLKDKLVEAEQMYQEALKGMEKAWEHPLTPSTVHELGNFYTGQGRWAEAEQTYRRALKGNEKTWGSEHALTLVTINMLGLTYAFQGKEAEADQMYKRALPITESGKPVWMKSVLDGISRTNFNDLGHLPCLESRSRSPSPDSP